MISLPLITPRDPHELWFGSSHPYRGGTHPHHNHDSHAAGLNPRRNGGPGTGAASGLGSGPSPLSYRSSGAHHNKTGNTLSSLMVEERALRARKNNIASFGCSWIRPAGCPKTMLGMKEEEAEREEALAAADAELAAAAAGGGEEETGMDEEDETGMERDLDDEIPDADADGDGDVDVDDEEGGDGDVDDRLVEEGEEGLEEDEEGYMERDLDDDIPEAFAEDDDDDDEGLEDFDNQPDLDDDIPSAIEEMSDEEVEEDDEEEVEYDDDGDEEMGRDLDDDIPEAEAQSDEENEEEGEEEEWQHTDTDAEFDDEDDEVSFSHETFSQSQNLRASTASSTHGLPPARPHQRETEAQRRFLQRWSGGGDTLDTSSMMVDEEDLRASLASQTSEQSAYRFPRRRTGRPRDSFE